MTWLLLSRPKGQTGCPACGGQAVHPAQRRWLKHPLRFLTGKRPYRCEACATRFWNHPVNIPVRESGAQGWPAPFAVPDDAPDVELDLEKLDAILEAAVTDQEGFRGLERRRSQRPPSKRALRTGTRES